MLIYEVTAVVDEPIRADFERFMAERHIPDVLATGKFAAAFFAGSDGLYRIGYHCDSRELLDAYYAENAAALRADVAERFPTGIELSRKELDIVELFPGKEEDGTTK
jgi:hypothetical protein